MAKRLRKKSNGYWIPFLEQEKSVGNFLGKFLGGPPVGN